MQPHDNSQTQFPLTPEEKDQFQNCLNEFSFSSSLPYMFVGGVAGYLGPLYFGRVRTGIMCSAVGMFSGMAYAKYVHLKKCFGKLMMNPSFAERYKSFVESKGLGPTGSYSLAPQIPRTEEYTEQPELQSDTTPTLGQSYDPPPLFSEDISVRKDKFIDEDRERYSASLPGTRYDELRRKNREDFYRNQGQVTQPYKPPPPAGQTEEEPKVFESKEYPKTTKYGDVWA